MQVFIENVQVFIMCGNHRECVVIRECVGYHRECVGNRRECAGNHREYAGIHRECAGIYNVW